MLSPVEEIKERLNIVDVVGEYVKLKNAGANHKGLCPFHNESTPSFTVSESKQFFHCFGCGKGGDIFTFVQEVESAEFAEVLRMLAAKAGVELKVQNPREENKKTRLLDCLSEATQFFEQQLADATKGGTSQQYVKDRGITGETAKQFQLGYALDSWDALMNHLKSKKFSQQEMEDSGLIIRSSKNNSYYDRFRNRVVFPICNTHGNVVGFTARTLSADEKEAKYINSPQTPLYNKSAVLYGLHLAKKHIQKIDAVVLVEGNMDVVQAHQAKFRNMVASSGTALTSEQVRLLKRYTNNILLAFDADEAGIRAAWKGMQIAIQEGMNIKVIRLPEGKDPDDIIRENPDTFRTLAGEAKPFMEYAFTAIMEPLDLSQAIDKKQAAAELLPMLALIPDEIEQTHYVQQLAGRLGVSESILQNKLKPARVAQQPSQRPQEQQPVPQQQSQSKEDSLYERLLTLCVAHPDILAKARKEVDVREIENQQLHSLYNDIETLYSNNRSFDPAHFLPSSASAKQLWAKVQLEADELYTSLDQEKREKEFSFLLHELQRYRLHNRLKAVQQQLTAAEQSNDTSAIAKLSQELSEITQSLRTL